MAAFNLMRCAGMIARQRAEASALRKPSVTSSVVLAAFASFLVGQNVFAAGSPEIEDAAARIQYAYYTADVRALQDVYAWLASQETTPQSAALKDYYLGFAQWKSAELQIEQVREAPNAQLKASVIQAAHNCEKHMQAVARMEPRMAEALALESRCAGLPQSVRADGTHTASNTCARSKGLRTALVLEPRNPRVSLIEHLCQTDVDQLTATQFEQLRTIVARFDDLPASSSDRPDWGLPEALLLLGRAYLQQGNSLAAREALERALVLAPDFKAAQRLLQAASIAR